MAETILFNEGYNAGAIAFFLVSEKGVGFADSYVCNHEESHSFQCGYEIGFNQYQ